jgi:two-component system response regulator HydG
MTPRKNDERSGGMLSLRDFEREHILGVLEECDGNQAKAARKLRIGRTTLWRKVREYRAATDAEHSASPPASSENA